MPYPQPRTRRDVRQPRLGRGSLVLRVLNRTTGARSLWLHDNETSGREGKTLDRLAKKHRQGSLDDAEHFFLHWLPVASPLDAWRIAPEVRLRVLKVGK
jgi:hypothetical protein